MFRYGALRRNANRQVLVALDEAGIDPLRFLDELDVVEALEDLLPDDLQLQLRIVWEEILKRFDNIEVVEEPKRVYSSFIKGYEHLPVRIAA